MSEKTAISWTDRTWNPVRGCSMAKGSETGGCLNCYAARMAARNLPGWNSPTTGKPFARILASGPRWTGDVELIESKITEPLRWKKPARVFVNSISDLFHEDLPDEAIDRVFAIMALCPQHTFQVLTKRPERMLKWATRAYHPGSVNDWLSFMTNKMTRLMFGDTFHGIKVPLLQDKQVNVRFPLPNVWLGVSVENQQTADERIPLLLQTPAAIRFVSYEPALGPVDFRWSWVSEGRPINVGPSCNLQEPWKYPEPLPRIDWLIAGHESGPKARPCDEEWIRHIKDQCVFADVAFFYKQAIVGGKKIEEPTLDGQKWAQFPTN